MDRGDASRVTAWTQIALTIAASDSGGGAGVQADLKTFAALGVYGASAVTALTAQNTRGVSAIHYAPPEIVAAQIEAVLDDFCVAAIKIGMLGAKEIVGAVAEVLAAEPSYQPAPATGRGGGNLLPQGLPNDGRLSSIHVEGGAKRRMRAFIVYDPVMAASSGDRLSGG